MIARWVASALALLSMTLSPVTALEVNELLENVVLPKYFTAEYAVSSTVVGPNGSISAEQRVQFRRYGSNAYWARSEIKVGARSTISHSLYDHSRTWKRSGTKDVVEDDNGQRQEYAVNLANYPTLPDSGTACFARWHYPLLHRLNDETIARILNLGEGHAVLEILYKNQTHSGKSTYYFRRLNDGRFLLQEIQEDAGTISNTVTFDYDETWPSGIPSVVTEIMHGADLRAEHTLILLSCKPEADRPWPRLPPEVEDSGVNSSARNGQLWTYQPTYDEEALRRIPGELQQGPRSAAAVRVDRAATRAQLSITLPYVLGLGGTLTVIAGLFLLFLVNKNSPH